MTKWSTREGSNRCRSQQTQKSFKMVSQIPKRVVSTNLEKLVSVYFPFFFWPGSYLQFEGNSPAVTWNYIWHNRFSSHTSLTSSIKMKLYIWTRDEKKKLIDLFFFGQVLLLLFSPISSPTILWRSAHPSGHWAMRGFFIICWMLASFAGAALPCLRGFEGRDC